MKQGNQETKERRAAPRKDQPAARRNGAAAQAPVGSQRAGRMSVGTPQVPEKGLKLRKEAFQKTHWYLKREGELAVVTAEARNDALGIIQLDVFEASEAQARAGILCKVRMTTLVGIDENITIFASERNFGEIYLRMSGSRNVAAEGQPARWMIDRKITKAAEAQILSYIDSLLVIEN